MERFNLRLPLADTSSWKELVPACQEVFTSTVADLLRGMQIHLPEVSGEIELFCTHYRPHLDEYFAMLLFRSCLPGSCWNIPVQETIIQDAFHDSTVCEAWSRACVFGLGNVQTGGAHPLLVFDEHTQTGKTQHASSALALVTQQLFGQQRLPQPVFLLSREIDLVDACGGAHPKHLTSYLVRLHDAADTPLALDPVQKQMIVEACFVAVLQAYSQKIQFWNPDFWHQPAMRTLQNTAYTSPLRQQPGFDQALTALLRNLDTFRQPYFPSKLTRNSRLSFASRGQHIFQCLVIPFISALLLEVFGEETGGFFCSHLWNTRLQGQIRYNVVFDALEQHLGSEPEDCDVETPVGQLSFREVHLPNGNAEMAPWIIDFTPANGMGNVRQALISYVRKNHMDVAYTILRNPESGTLVLSRGHGIPMEQWDAMIAWLLEWEGSSDIDGEPGCWHEVTSANGVHADFLLNGNAAHQYVPHSEITCDILADWLQKQAKVGSAENSAA